MLSLFKFGTTDWENCFFSVARSIPTISVHSILQGCVMFAIFGDHDSPTPSPTSPPEGPTEASKNPPTERAPEDTPTAITSPTKMKKSDEEAIGVVYRIDPSVPPAMTPPPQLRQSRPSFTSPQPPRLVMGPLLGLVDSDDPAEYLSQYESKMVHSRNLHNKTGRFGRAYRGRFKHEE